MGHLCLLRRATVVTKLQNTQSRLFFRDIRTCEGPKEAIRPDYFVLEIPKDRPIEFLHLRCVHASAVGADMLGTSIYRLHLAQIGQISLQIGLGQVLDSPPQDPRSIHTLRNHRDDHVMDVLRRSLRSTLAILHHLLHLHPLLRGILAICLPRHDQIP